MNTQIQSPTIFLFINNVVHTTAEETFCKLNELLTANKIDCLKCVGVRADGAPAMPGKFIGLIIAWIQKIIPSVT